MLLRRHRRNLAKDKSGAAAIEFAIISIALVMFTLGILDVGFALFWFNRAEKATQLGVRIAAVSSPVSDLLLTLDGTTGGGGPGPLPAPHAKPRPAHWQPIVTMPTSNVL